MTDKSGYDPQRNGQYREKVDQLERRVTNVEKSISKVYRVILGLMVAIILSQWIAS